MSLTFQCGKCGHQYTVPDQLAGKWVKCKRCDSAIEVPGQSTTTARPTPNRPLTQARPIPAPQIGSTPSAPIPEAILVPEPTAQVSPQPAPPDLPVSPRNAEPARPVPQPALQPLSPAPFQPTNRARITASGEDGIDKKVIVIAVAAVGIVLAAAVLMIVVMFSSDPGRKSETASPDGGAPAGREEPGVVDFSREPSVEFAAPRTMSSGRTGVVWKEVQLKGQAGTPGIPGKLWVYLPSGTHEPHSLGCVLIGPAGSRMLHGMALAEGDQPEHFPYAEQGVAVVAFEIDGPLPDDEPADDRFREAYLRFTAAAAGVVNARIALQYATTEMPEVDPDRVFVAGHSSAGTVALLCAEHVDGLAGCAAYAPCSDLDGFLKGFVGEIEGVLPHVRRYMKDGSPTTHAAKIRCPVMIFHALDDQVVRLSESNTFSNRALTADRDIILQTEPRGGHYDAMIDEGIDQAICWMNLTKPPSSTVASRSASPSPTTHTRPSPTSAFHPPSRPMGRSAGPSSGSIRAHVHFKIISYPRSGNPNELARKALQNLLWADPDSIRVDRSANEIVIGVCDSSLNTNTARLNLEKVGFVVGASTYKSVRNGTGR